MNRKIIMVSLLSLCFSYNAFGAKAEIRNGIGSMIQKMICEHPFMTGAAVGTVAAVGWFMRPKPSLESSIKAYLEQVNEGNDPIEMLKGKILERLFLAWKAINENQKLSYSKDNNKIQLKDFSYNVIFLSSMESNNLCRIVNAFLQNDEHCSNDNLGLGLLNDEFVDQKITHSFLYDQMVAIIYKK